MSTSEPTPEQPAETAEPTGPQSSVIQPPPEQQQPLANEPDTAEGEPVDVDHVGDGQQPGLSPAFHDNDLITDGPHTAPTTAASTGEAPRPANQPGQPLADEQPTDEAQATQPDSEQELHTCPVCQHTFPTGSPVL